MASLSLVEYRIHIDQDPHVSPLEDKQPWKLKIVNETRTSVIFERHDCSHVLKKATASGCHIRSEYDFHLRILGDFEDHTELTKAIMIPSVITPLIPKAAKNWHEEHEPLFSTPHNLHADIHVMEQIPPIPLETQRYLAKRYNPTAASRMPKFSTNCLVQLRLGSKSTAPVRYLNDEDLKLSLPLARSLPNFPLITLAKLLADILAILHFEVCTDAAGIKFVLGGAPFPEHSHDVKGAIKLPLGGRDTYLWMLSFDECENIDEHEDGVVRAAMALLGNDAFPQPGGTSAGGDVDVWSVFVFRYLETVSERFGTSALEMAVNTVEEVVERVGKREAGKRGLEEGEGRTGLLRRSKRLRE